MVGNGGKWSRNGEKWRKLREMEGNGGRWREIERNRSPFGTEASTVARCGVTLFEPVSSF